MGVAVLVRVDGQLETGEHLIRAAVDRHAAGGVRLPACDPDRQQRRSRRDARQPGRPSRADDEPGHLGSVPLRPSRRGRVLTGTGVAPRVEHVEPGQQGTANVGVDDVDAGVEQGNRHACAGEPRNPDVGAPPAADLEQVAGVDCGRDGGAHREHAQHIGVAGDDRQRARVERGREPVENAVVGVLGLDRSPPESEPGDHLALRVARAGRPGTLLLLRRHAAGRRDPGGE